MFSFIWHTFFFDPVYNTLVFFIDVIPSGDIGLAIIATVLLIKTILLPVSIKAAKTQRVMKEIDPQLRAVKEQYKEDKQLQAQKMMEVYREAGMNPFASIFLVFLQIPVIIALYFAVSGLITKSQGVVEVVFNSDILYSFIPVPSSDMVTTMLFGVFEIADRSLPLAILAGVTQFIHINFSMPKLPAKEADAEPNFKDDFMRNMQLQMKYVMPIIIIVVAYSISAAIALYFVVSNLTMIAQEFWVKKHR